MRLRSPPPGPVTRHCGPGGERSQNGGCGGWDGTASSFSRARGLGAAQVSGLLLESTVRPTGEGRDFGMGKCELVLLVTGLAPRGHHFQPEGSLAVLLGRFPRASVLLPPPPSVFSLGGRCGCLIPARGGRGRYGYWGYGWVLEAVSQAAVQSIGSLRGAEGWSVRACWFLRDFVCSLCEVLNPADYCVYKMLVLFFRIVHWLLKACMKHFLKTSILCSHCSPSFVDSFRVQ